jgi:hypothetical protein
LGEYLETEANSINSYKKIELVDVIRGNLNKLIGYDGLQVEDDLDIISEERNALVRKMRESCRRRTKSFERIRERD